MFFCGVAVTLDPRSPMDQGGSYLGIRGMQTQVPISNTCKDYGVIILGHVYG